MATPPIIAVDIDDVLSDHASGFVEFSNNDDQVKHCMAAAECGTKSLLFGEYAWNRTTKGL